MKFFQIGFGSVAASLLFAFLVAVELAGVGQLDIAFAVAHTRLQIDGHSEEVAGPFVAAGEVVVACFGDVGKYVEPDCAVEETLVDGSVGKPLAGNKPETAGVPVVPIVLADLGNDFVDLGSGNCDSVGDS